MRIDFEDKSFIEMELSKVPDKINIILGAIDFENPLKKVINSAEISIKDFSKLINSLGIDLKVEGQ